MKRKTKGLALKFWYVRQGEFDWYYKHPDIISWKKSSAEGRSGKTFRAIRKSDKVVYYVQNPPKGIIGIFDVKTDCAEKIITGKEPSLYYEISPLFVANGDLEKRRGKALMVSQKPKPFVAKNVVGECLRPMGIVFELKPEQYRKIKADLLRMNEPTNHKELENLFIKVHTYFGFQKIEKHQIRYPDAFAIDFNGKEKRIEFEFDSYSFSHDDWKKHDIIVCWKDGWGIARHKGLELIELQPLYGGG